MTQISHHGSIKNLIKYSKATLLNCQVENESICEQDRIESHNLTRTELRKRSEEGVGRIHSA